MPCRRPTDRSYWPFLSAIHVSVSATRSVRAQPPTLTLPVAKLADAILPVMTTVLPLRIENSPPTTVGGESGIMGTPPHDTATRTSFRIVNRTGVSQSYPVPPSHSPLKSKLPGSA